MPEEFRLCVRCTICSRLFKGSPASWGSSSMESEWKARFISPGLLSWFFTYLWCGGIIVSVVWGLNIKFVKFLRDLFQETCFAIVTHQKRIIFFKEDSICYNPFSSPTKKGNFYFLKTKIRAFFIVHIDRFSNIIIFHNHNNSSYIF